MTKRNFTPEQKNKIWERENGKKMTSVDPFGIKVAKTDFDADHVVPFSKGGKTTLKNGQVLSHKSNIEKSDKMSGEINGRSFRVSKTTSKMSVKKSK